MLLRIFSFVCLASAPLWAVTGPVGGGFLDGGLEGTYFSDDDFTTEAFQRRDLRLDFDWGSLQRPGGGLPGTQLHNLGADSYSVRWEGRLMPRFTETYTIHAEADSVRVWIKPEGASWGSVLIESWPGADPATYLAQTATYDFVAGQAYDIRVEYRERTGPARLRLLWSSPSTPEEVIQPTAMVGNIPPDRGVILADAVQAATNWREASSGDGVLDIGPDGWPVEDFQFILRPTDYNLHLGHYLLTFEGTARVRIGVGGGELRSEDGGTSYGSEAPAGAGYDAATNTTRLRVVITNDQRSDFWPNFRDTDRDGPGSLHGTGSGLTNVRMMRPVSPGAETWHGEDEWIARDARALFETFVTLRWNDVNGNNDARPDGAPGGQWAYRRAWEPNTRNIRYTSENHEYKILLSNHTGRDLYIQVPYDAGDAYILNLARLIRYGADASGMPYSSEQSAPHFPPLNANLRVNLEYANEIPWNSAGQFPQGNWARAQPEALRQAWLADPNSADGLRWQILNYDGAFSNSSDASGMQSGIRFCALRAKEMSDIFRSVFGDDAMPAPGRQDPRVRPLYMYQYDNSNSTATQAFTFLDGYFNKTSPLSTYSGTPKPVTHFLYAAGAATYYASADRLGALHDHALTQGGEGSFELPLLADGEAVVAPAGSPWRFTGTAGIYRKTARSAGTLGAVATLSNSVDDFNHRGMRITVGSQDVAIYEVGRMLHGGNSAPFIVAIYEADAPHESLFRYEFEPAAESPVGQVVWQHTGREVFILSRKNYSFPIILEAGKSYYIVCEESASGNSHSGPTAFTPPPGVSVDGAAKGRLDGDVWTWQTGATPNQTYGPLNFRLAAVPSITNTGLPLGFLNDSFDGMEDNRSLDPRFFSDQAAFLAGEGSMEIDITVPHAGVFGLIYGLAHKRDQTPYDANDDTGENRIIIELIEDGVARAITPNGQSDIRPLPGSTSGEGYWTKPNTGYDFFGSAPFEITDPNKTYTIRFRGTDVSTDRVALIDNVQLASADKMTEGTIPSGGGFAEGAPDVSNWEARVMSMYKYAQSFGLKAMSYEGGWYPGGDANKMPLQFASSFYAQAMLQGEKNAINALARAGLVVNTDYTLNFAIADFDYANAGDYQRIAAWRELNGGLPAEPTNGQPLTSIFSPENAWLSHQVDGAVLQPGGSFFWNVIAPESGEYSFRIDTVGSGSVAVRIDETHEPISGSAGGSLTSTGSIYLSKGLHSLRVLARSGAPELVALSVTKAGQAPGFSTLSGSPGNAEVYLSWAPQAGATGYHVYVKSRLESDFTRYTSAPVTDTVTVVGGLLNASTYNFVVTWLDGSGQESAFSNQVNVVPGDNPSLLTWEFDDSTAKVAGSLPPSTRSIKLVDNISLLAGPERSLGSNSHANQDAAVFQGFWSGDIPDFRDDHWMGFDIQPASGTLLRLTELTVGIWRSGSATFDAEIRYSLDGFVTETVLPLDLDPATAVPGGNMTPSTGVPVTADLRGEAALRNLTDADTVSFRIFFRGTDASYWGLGKLGDDTDDIVLNGFPIDPLAAEPPEADLPTGVYAGPLAVTLNTATSGTQIRYTLDGSRPTETHGTLIDGSSGTAVLTQSATLRAVAFGPGIPVSNVFTRSYTLVAQAAAPQFTPGPGALGMGETVHLFSPTTRAYIRYTTDGSEPSASHGSLYLNPISLTADTTIKAIAYRDDLVPSAVNTGLFVVSLDAYTAWTQTHAWQGRNSGPAGDPDHDGLPNLLEYALGHDPLVRTARAHSGGWIDGVGLQLSFHRARSELTYIVEASDDLVQWSPIATNPGTVGETVVVDDIALPEPPPTRRFLRLRVLQP